VSVLSLTAGYFSAKSLLSKVSPILPAAGTEEDNVLMSELNRRIDELFRVKILRGKCLGVTKQLKGEQCGWVEIVPPVSAGDDRTAMLPFHDRLIDSLQGAKGLGVERIFWSREDKKLIAVVWFGRAMSGWPAVVHGGLLATALDEKIALAAALEYGGERDVKAAAAPQRMPGTGNHASMACPTTVPQEPAQMSVDYLKPTFTDDFYVIRVQPSWAVDEHVRLNIPDAEYIATLETMDDKVCVRAAAKFAPRSELERLEETVQEKTGWSYKEFREWVWPSRQQQSQVG
jgi:hypothetical protein